MKKQGRARRPKRPKRPKYTADRPLDLAVRVPRVQEIPPPAWRAAVSRPLFSFVNALPQLTNTAAGRKKAQTFRGALGITALMLVIAAKDGEWWLGGLGIGAALTLVFVPLSGVRKARWIHRLSRVAGGSQRVIEAPASLHFNGTKLTIRGDDDGKAWASARPLVAPHVTVWGERHGEAWLGILNPRGKKRDSVWFRCPEATALVAGGPSLDQALGRHVSWDLDQNVTAATADAGAFDALFRALGPPQSPKLVASPV